MSGRKRAMICSALLIAFFLCACGKTGAADKTVVVLRETEAPTAAAEPVISAESPEPASTRPSDWYGWWRMFNTSGDWAHMYGYYWDCCAEIRKEDDSLRLQLWDEDISKYIGLSSARILEDSGTLKCKVGAFLDREIGPDDWRITRTQDTCGVLLHIEGSYEAVGKGGFQYEIFLRPWGSRWPGSEDEKPHYYENWYLPLIDAGVRMPDEIGKGT